MCTTAHNTFILAIHSGRSQSWHDGQWALTISTIFPILLLFSPTKFQFICGHILCLAWKTISDVRILWFLHNELVLPQTQKSNKNDWCSCFSFLWYRNLEKCQSIHFNWSNNRLFSGIFSFPANSIHTLIEIQPFVHIDHECR